MSIPAGIRRRIRDLGGAPFRQIQQQFNRARPGSVLILVVALLVLLALMGTAFISVSRVDRYSSQQNSFNTEIDLLVQGVMAMVEAKILTAPDAPINTPTVEADSTIWTYANDPNLPATSTGYFSPRVPIVLPNGSQGWSSVTAPAIGGNFESPYLGTQYGTLTNLVPTSISVTSLDGTTTIYPALIDPSSGKSYLAGSASGDGIADAGLWRLPIGEVNGLTYYAAVRVIDNGSAVNASIAFQPNPATGSSSSQVQSLPTALPGDFFPTNIDMLDMLLGGAGSASTQMQALNAYRWNAASASLTPIYDDPNAANGTPMTNFMFMSTFDAMWSQLGRRLDNPGINAVGNGTTGPVYYQTLPISESMAMAHRFDLVNPSASPSLLEQYLAPSVLYNGSGAAIRNSPYSPDQVAQWFTDSFTYENGGNLRTLLVSRNQVSNIAASRLNNRINSSGSGNAWDAALTYSFGDWVTGADGCTYVCIQDNTTSAIPPTPYSNMATWTNWAQEPWLDYPVKTSVNTGTFGQLWLAYWSTMSGGSPGQPDSASALAMFRDPIRGAVSGSAASSNGNTSSGGTETISPTGGDDTSNIQSIINQSAAGDTVAFTAGTYNISHTIILAPNRKYSGGGSISGILGLTPAQTLRLRSALAAINTQQLRGSNSQILSKQIAIGASLTPTTRSGGATLNWTAGNVNNSAIAQCTGGTTTEFTGFIVEGCQVNFQSGTFNVHDNTFTNTYRGIFVSGNSGTINNNSFTFTSQEGIYGYPGSNGIYNNNNFDNDKNDAIHLAAASGSGTTVSGNVITNCHRIGIELQLSGQGIAITDNYASVIEPTGGSWGAFSIACVNANGVTVTGNTGVNDRAGSGMCVEIYGFNAVVSNNISWDFNCCILDGAQGPVLQASGNTVYGGALMNPDAPPPGGGDAPIVGVNTVLPLSAMPNPPAAPSNSTSSSTTQPSETPASLTYRILLYATGQQPYITEVYANNDQSTANQGQTGNAGFMAISFYNPYNTTISLKNWQFATINRQNGVSSLVVQAIPGAPTDLSTMLPSLAPYQRVVFASSNSMPKNITVDSGAGTPIIIPQLTAAFGNELMLIRPHNPNGTLTTTNIPGTPTYDPTDLYDETANLDDFVPVDCYDFTGLPAAPSQDDADSTEWHYVRPSDQAGHNWYFVYPYTYNNNPAINPTLTATPPVYATSSNPGEPLPLPRLFATMVSNGASPSAVALGAADTAPANSYYANYGLPIQINNTDFGGPKGMYASQYPYGGFARNGDILQTTFIGAYRIDLLTVNTDGTSSTQTIEYNPVTMDSAFADDLNNNDNQAENVGRFCPLSPADCGGLFNDFDRTSTPGSSRSAYHFAIRLFDFVTATGPADDYMQNLGAEDLATRYPIANVKPKYANAYPAGVPVYPTTEDNAPTDGLININTAPWRVLATLPMANNASDNQTLAKAIVYYRDVNNGSGSPHGPFKSIFELNGVPNFRNTLASTALGAFNPKGQDNGPSDGDLAPYIAGADDYVPGDFEKQFLAFNRISNLVTTRSDSFTAYILVEGWQNAGTSNPQLVVQRRVAFIADRSGMTPSNKVMNVTNVP